MKEEFNLSNKRERTTTQSNDTTISNCFYLYNEKDVKEFIKKLKAKVRDEINNPYTQKPTVHLGIVLKWINELAGDKLK